MVDISLRRIEKEYLTLVSRYGRAQDSMPKRQRLRPPLPGGIGRSFADGLAITLAMCFSLGSFLPTVFSETKSIQPLCWMELASSVIDCRTWRKAAASAASAGERRLGQLQVRGSWQGASTSSEAIKCPR